MPRRLAAALALLPALALASADSVPNVSARDLGIAQALVAAQDGAGAAYANPAALSRISGLDLSLTGAIIDNGTKWTSTSPAAPGSVKSKFHPAPGPSVFAAYGGELWGRGWGVGLGMNVPEGGNIVWPEDWPGRNEILKVDRRVYAGYLTGGIEVLPRIRLGGGLVYYRTTELLRANFTQGPADFGPASVDSSGDAFTYALSAEVEPIPGLPLTVGVDYKHKAHQKLRGEVVFDVPNSQSLLGQGVTHRFVVPNMLSAGLAYRPLPALLLAFQWNLDRYRVYQEDRFVGDGGLLQVTVPRNYGNGYTLRGGAEYALSPNWQVRAGLLRDHTGMQARYFDPSLPDADVWAGTAGLSYLAPALGLGIHAGVFYARYAEVDNTDPNTTDLQGKWQSQALIASLGVTWRLGR